ncbi:MAG: SUF system NifU family Fe-S cluster assembly protein [Armatimonadota bacterium]
MADLRELYQEVILDHNKSPRNFGKLESPTHQAEGYNPLCGDHYWVYLTVSDGIISDIAFEGSGCAISKAAASLMTSLLKGKPVSEAEKLFERYRAMVTGQGGGDPSEMGRLVVFSEVKNYPTRIKCAVLPWHTLHAALAGEQTASTE